MKLHIKSAFSVQTLFHTTLSIIKLPLLLLLSSLGQKRHKGKLSAAGKERYQLTFHSENPELDRLKPTANVTLKTFPRKKYKKNLFHVLNTIYKHGTLKF